MQRMMKSAKVTLRWFGLSLAVGGAAFAGEAASSSSASLEKRIEGYLSNRVLVFRDCCHAGRQIRFNAAGQRLPGDQPGGESPYHALLFRNAKLKGPILQLQGETVTLRVTESGRTYVRAPRELRLVTVGILFETPGNPSFSDMIRALARVFLTGEEMGKGPSRLGQGARAARWAAVLAFLSLQSPCRLFQPRSDVFPLPSVPILLLLHNGAGQNGALHVEYRRIVRVRFFICMRRHDVLPTTHHLSHALQDLGRHSSILRQLALRARHFRSLSC